MTHPFHPDSPEYPDMLAAGRVGPDSHRPRPYGGAPVCQASIPVRGSQAWTRCGEPIAALETRGGIGQYVCLAHGIEAKDRGSAVTWSCSVCGTPQRYPSHLDGSGRCLECAP